MQDEGPVPSNLLVATGFPNAFTDGGLDGGVRDLPQMFWQGPARGTRRRFAGMSGHDFFFQIY